MRYRTDDSPPKGSDGHHRRFTQTLQDGFVHRHVLSA